jgi:hypothetical protein
VIFDDFSYQTVDGASDGCDQLQNIGTADFPLCAGHAQQSGGESPLPNLMEVKG